MGTVFSFAASAAPAPGAVASVEAELDRIERVFSTYRHDSEVNALADGRRPLSRCSPDVQEVLELCAEARVLTGGYFNALHSGRLDPTGLVKGWAVARTAAMLADAGVRRYAVNGGGDILTSADPALDEPWRIGVTDGDAVVARVCGHNVAVATSGNTERPGLVVDPFTERVALALRAVTVAGADVVLADAVATAALAMGDQAFGWLAGRPEFAGLVITADGTVSITRGFTKVDPAPPAVTSGSRRS